MIPLKLSIQGLYSYQDLQEIDFRRLTNSSVFGIFGKVGSGKTSLLEAMSFALYGETERLNSRDNRQYNMMNLKSKHLIIDFEFQAGPEQQVYKFVYEAKRHARKHHEIGPGERRMFVRRENDWHPIGNEKEDIAILTRQLLGVDYDNFKRTIIIPQNQFREFLELSPVERTRMMNQLFKLDQYDLAARVGKLIKNNDNQLAELRGLLAPLETITPEAVEEAKANVASIAESLTQKEQEISALDPVEKQLLHTQKQADTLVLAQRQLDALLVDEQRYQQARNELALYERCQLYFRSDLTALTDSRERQIALSSQIVDNQNFIQETQKKQIGLRAEYEAAKQAFDNRDQLLQQISELDVVQRIRTLQQAFTLQTKNRTDLTDALDKQQQEIDRYKAESRRYQLVIDSFGERESNLERLYKVQNWFSVYNPLKKRADELQSDIEEYEKRIEYIKRDKNTALSGFPTDWSSLTLKTLPTEIDMALEQFKKAEKSREIKYQRALVQFELQQYANALHDGQPCPLCGSEHHPNRHQQQDNKAELEQSETALNEVRQKITDTTELRLAIKALETRLRSELDYGKRLIQERVSVVQELTAHEDTFAWSEFPKDNENLVAQAIEQESNDQKKLAEARKAIESLNKQLDEADVAYRAIEKQQNDIDKEIFGINKQIQSDAKLLNHFRLDELSNWSLAQIDALRVSFREDYDWRRHVFEQAGENLQAVETEYATLDERLRQLTNQQTELADEQTVLEKKIAKNLTKYKLSHEQVEQVLSHDRNVDEEKQRIQTYDNAVGGHKKQIADLTTELAQNPFDADRLTAVQEQLRQLRTDKDDLNKAFGKAGVVLKNVEDDWQQKQEYQQRFDALDLRQQDLKEMDTLFRAQGFVNYVSSVYLKNLCESANERFFKLTNSQLKLELDEKNNFQVRDYLNGGEMRSVKTLSGGQMFQAALSLALALSDNIQQLTKAKQNLFFIDEGFGTLDRDSLQTVFKTLKALRSENRVVGIISHVEELQQEVDTFICAEASENGSRIVASWDV